MENETGALLSSPPTMMIHKRANPKPLHNFALPRLRWGNRKQARCMKVVDHSAWPSSSILAAQRWSSVVPSFDWTRLAASPGEEEEEDDGEGIEAVREKLMLDLRAETDKIKKEQLKGDGDGDEEAKAETIVVAATKEGKKLADVAATAQRKENHVAETRSWNLRTRRAACKAPAATDNSSTRKKEVSATRDVKGSPEKGKDGVKFAVALKKKEIEEDFVKLTGHRPPRQPKKRLFSVRKKSDVS